MAFVRGSQDQSQAAGSILTHYNQRLTCHILVMVLQPQYLEPQHKACAKGLVAFLYRVYE